jgi:Protein of unknown function (DUF541)
MHVPPRSPGRKPRRLSGLLLIPFLLIAAGCSTAGSPATSRAAVGGGASPAGPASDALPGAPAQAPSPASGGAGAANGAGVSNGGTSSSGAGIAAPNQAIAYPYPIYPGSPGVAADHTIVVVGVGEAGVKADLSDRASAQRNALAAALADAKAQADVVAGTAGVRITGVLSVSVSSGQGYAIPMVSGGAGAVPGATGSGPTTGVPPAVMPVEPGITQLTVSVTVAYSIG